MALVGHGPGSGLGTGQTLMERGLKGARHAHTRGPQGSWGLCHSHSLTRSHGPVSWVPAIPAPLQRHEVDWGVSPQGGVCVLGCTHTRVCTLSGRRGSLLIPFQRVPPPPPKTSGQKGLPSAGTHSLGSRASNPAPSTPTLAAFGGRWGESPLQSPWPSSSSLFPSRLGGSDALDLAWVSLCWSTDEAHLTSLLLSAAAGRTHGWEQGGIRDRIFSKWGRVPSHPERTSAWLPSLPPSGPTLAFVNKRCGLC